MTNKYVMPDGDLDTEAYLKDNNYKSVEEWALDSDYSYDKNEDYWFDEEGHPVDIEVQLWFALESSIEDED